MIDFEKDQQDSLRRTDNIQSLADRIKTSRWFTS
jgi:hypothetical protein